MGHWVLSAILASLVSQSVPSDPLLIVPDAAVLKIDELGLYRFGLAYRGLPERDFPAGWAGPFDEQTGVACQPVGIQNGRQAFDALSVAKGHRNHLPGVSHSASQGPSSDTDRGDSTPCRWCGQVRRRDFSDLGRLAKTAGDQPF